jgi:hypothetical protein
MTKLAPRYFILPLIALTVIGSLPAPADNGRASGRAGCGPAIDRTTDPGLRRAFERFERGQSAGADRICALYRNAATTIVR